MRDVHVLFTGVTGRNPTEPLVTGLPSDYTPLNTTPYPGTSGTVPSLLVVRRAVERG